MKTPSTPSPGKASPSPFWRRIRCTVTTAAACRCVGAAPRGAPSRLCPTMAHSPATSPSAAYCATRQGWRSGSRRIARPRISRPSAARPWPPTVKRSAIITRAATPRSPKRCQWWCSSRARVSRTARRWWPCIHPRPTYDSCRPARGVARTAWSGGAATVAVASMAASRRRSSGADRCARRSNASRTTRTTCSSTKAARCSATIHGTCAIATVTSSHRMARQSSSSRDASCPPMRRHSRCSGPANCSSSRGPRCGRSPRAPGSSTRSIALKSGRSCATPRAPSS